MCGWTGALKKAGTLDYSYDRETVPEEMSLQKRYEVFSFWEADDR